MLRTMSSVRCIMGRTVPHAFFGNGARSSVALPSPAAAITRDLEH